MWTLVWPIAELQRLDRESQKIIVETGGKHPSASNDLLYLPRRSGGRGLQSIEPEYKITKVKEATRLYANADPTMRLVQRFEERAERTGRRSLVRDAQNYAEELGTKQELRYPDPPGTTAENEKIEGRKIGMWTKKHCEGVREQRWQVKTPYSTLEDKDLDDESFEWMSDWKTAPTHTIAGKRELYEQLLPTKLYNTRKPKIREESEVRCKMCEKAQEFIAHVLSSCSALVRTKYLSRHNGALKILFFELLKDYQLIEAVPPWYSATQLKPLYQNDQVTAYWEVPVYANYTEVRANSVDARIVDKERKTVTLLELSCPWIENRKQKDEKTYKYVPLRWEIKKQYPGYKITQINIIMDVHGGCSKGLSSSVREILGAKRSRDFLGRMQKCVLSSSLNIARTFKVFC
ncbi:uncharacterized protein [Montipora capricornis]|uniref:uncharacterized protein n=1 Tax=Montipora capricornis TaxID=246305 RepID=UPI0035F0FC0F